MRYGIGERGRLSYCKQRLQTLFFGFVTGDSLGRTDEKGEKMPRRRVAGWSFAVTSRLFFQSAAQLRATVTGADSPSLASEFVVIGKRFPSAVHRRKEGESRDSWRRRLPSFCLRTLRARRRAG